MSNPKIEVQVDVEEQASIMIHRYNGDYRAAFEAAMANGADSNKNQQYWHAVADYILAQWSE